jgi:hypothetical protein
MNDSVDIEGLDQLLANLNSLPEAWSKPALEDAGRFALLPFLNTVRQLAPADDPADTPDRPAYKLRDSYIISTFLNERQERLNRHPKFVEVHAGTNDPVGTWREFGHFIVPPGTGMPSAWVAPQPHVAPAWQATSSTVLQRAASEMARNLDLSVRALKL